MDPNASALLHKEAAHSYITDAAGKAYERPIPEGSMRVGPGTDAVVWRTCPTHKATP